MESYSENISNLKESIRENEIAISRLSWEGFVLQVEWIDKIITLSVSIISFTITLLIAMKDKNSEYSSFGSFSGVWLVLAASGVLCLFARFSYSRLKLAQRNKRLMIRDKDISYHNTLVKLQNYMPMKDKNEFEILPKIDDENVLTGNNVKLWLCLVHCSSLLWFIFFVIGIALFILMGVTLVR